MPSRARLLRAGLEDDPADPPDVRCADPNDDYLIALAQASRAALVTGDAALLDLARSIPVFTPSGFLDRLAD